MICAQLFAYGHVNQQRMERKEVGAQGDEVAEIDALQRTKVCKTLRNRRGDVSIQRHGHLDATGKGLPGKVYLEVIREETHLGLTSEDGESKTGLR